MMRGLKAGLVFLWEVVCSRLSKVDEEGGGM